MRDFGVTDTSTPANAARGKAEKNYGIITLELPNGMKVDGYVLLGVKNLAKLGLSVDDAAALGQATKSLSGCKMHITFGERVITLATPVVFD